MKKRSLLYLTVSLFGIAYLLARYTTIPVPQAPSGREAGAAGQGVAHLLHALHAYGLKPTVESRIRYGTDSTGLFPVSSWWPATPPDVVATMPGTNSQGRILLYAHYKGNFSLTDSSAGGDASAALLHLIGALRKRPRLQNDLIFYFSAAEPNPTVEGESFRNHFSLAQEYDVLLEMEHQDQGGEVLLFFTSKYNYHLVETYADTALPAGPGRRREALPGRGTALAFVEFLGNKPLQRAPGLPQRVLPYPAHPQTGRSYPGLQPIDEAVQAFLQKWKIPGSAVAITKDGRLVYSRGFGFAHRHSYTLVQPTHQFRIASLSKPITAAAILLLMERGRLRLSSRVFGPGGILSDSSYGTIIDKRVEKITVRHLLEHSAGWDRDVSEDVMFDPVKIARIMRVHPPADNKSIIRYALSQPLDFSPGTRYAYSNVGYAVLGRVIEKLTGQPY